MEETFHQLGLLCWLQLQWIHIIIFYGISWPQDLCLFQTRNGPDHLDLHIHREACGQTIGINLVRIQSLRFQEYLVPLLLGKAHHLIFNGGTISGPHALYDTTVQGRAVQSLFYEIMGLLIGVGNVTRDLS